MNTNILPRITVASPNVPAVQLFWQGYDQFVLCAASRDWLSPEEYASMTDAERRGYEAAARHAADTDTFCYLANTNAYGDRTEY